MSQDKVDAVALEKRLATLEANYQNILSAVSGTDATVARLETKLDGLTGPVYAHIAKVKADHIDPLTFWMTYVKGAIALLLIEGGIIGVLLTAFGPQLWRAIHHGP